jgi:hypothetical protein
MKKLRIVRVDHFPPHPGSSTSSTMPETHYCWRCGRDVPMFTDAEWLILKPLVRSDIEIIKEYRTATGCSLDEALDRLPFDSSALVFQWSGCQERSLSTFHHHRLSVWGAGCDRCGHLLRTPDASFCANCGARPEK